MVQPARREAGRARGRGIPQPPRSDRAALCAHLPAQPNTLRVRLTCHSAELPKYCDGCCRRYLAARGQRRPRRTEPAAPVCPGRPLLPAGPGPRERPRGCRAERGSPERDGREPGPGACLRWGLARPCCPGGAPGSAAQPRLSAR